ncbi:MAG: hypothetical protein AAFN77_06590 [Planctomycetota bacterium]
MSSISLKSSKVKIGVVPTHLKFVGGLVPDDEGGLPRDDSGTLKVVANLKRLQEMSPVEISAVQIPFFSGVEEAAVAELVNGLKDLGLEVHFIMMVGGCDPMNPDDEETVVQLLVSGLVAAKAHGIQHVSSTSLEAWMQEGAIEKAGSEFDSAIQQLAKAHARAYREAEVEGSSIQAWHIEFLRKGEFQTFTDLNRVWAFIKAANQAVGRPFFQALVDAAHCGDSELSIEENGTIVQQLAESNEMGIFHASTKTTRGCFSTDDGWIGGMLRHASATGKLEHVFVEFFHHQDDALAGLRELDPRHGIDTTDGRSYDELVVDGLVEVARRLNNLVARGILDA